jgi:3-oxoacyl-[acyl-carrier protein] reductase
MKKLNGKIAIVSGSGRGIGRAVALKLAADGAKVVVNDIDAAPAEETVAKIFATGGEAVACIGNVTAPDFASRFVRVATEGFGGLDIIVNNAGYTWDGVLQNISDEQWQAMIDVHLTAPFRILRAASDFIRSAAKGEMKAGTPVFRKVVNVSSIAGAGGNSGQANYAAAKAGVIGLTRALAKEWGRYLVNVNCVAYGLIDTRLTGSRDDAASAVDIDGRRIRAGIEPALLASLEASIPLGRSGTPEEAAGAVALLCYPESNYVSGELLLCAGGFRI